MLSMLRCPSCLALPPADGRRPRKNSLERTDKLGSPDEAEMVIGMARAQAKKTVRAWAGGVCCVVVHADVC